MEKNGTWLSTGYSTWATIVEYVPKRHAISSERVISDISKFSAPNIAFLAF